MSNQQEVVIKLTEEQRQQIKSATGKDLAELKVEKDLPELKVETVEDRANPFGYSYYPFPTGGKG